MQFVGPAPYGGLDEEQIRWALSFYLTQGRAVRAVTGAIAEFRAKPGGSAPRLGARATS